MEISRMSPLVAEGCNNEGLNPRGSEPRSNINGQKRVMTSDMRDISILRQCIFPAKLQTVCCCLLALSPPMYINFTENCHGNFNLWQWLTQENNSGGSRICPTW